MNLPALVLIGGLIILVIVAAVYTAKPTTFSESSTCNDLPQGVSCNKSTETCFRYGAFYDQGKFCGTKCMDCQENMDYTVDTSKATGSFPAAFPYEVIVKSRFLPKDVPLGSGDFSSVDYPNFGPGFGYSDRAYLL